jgi:3-deoxy-D-manno-octulosonate 8-phosphate phosphatase (KDO 8-P phosphatase)|tara:strand:+ start:1445 stop:1963 length:519 start_codon:yes stop_codon:yes gene_type:complete
MIKLLILDIDGVMTDGTKVYGLDGLTIGKRYCDRDFTAIKQFKAAGVQVCFLSGDDKVNKAMAENRKTDFYYSRGRDKTDYIEEFSHTYNCSPKEMAYVGDDIFDIPIMKKVGYSYCPANVPQVVKDASSWVSSRNCGDNVIADLYENLVNLGLVGYSTLEDIKELDKLESF